MKQFILKGPALSEKTVKLAEKLHAYTFYVDQHANKNQIREAIETAYEVHVHSLRTIKLAEKNKKTGKKRLTVTMQPRKKAIVVLKPGEKITAFDVQG